MFVLAHRRAIAGSKMEEALDPFHSRLRKEHRSWFLPLRPNKLVGSNRPRACISVPWHRKECVGSVNGKKRSPGCRRAQSPARRRVRLDSSPSHSGCCAVESKKEVVLNSSYSPLDAAAADFALSRAICCLVRGSKVSAARKACFMIFILSIPVITTEVGRLKE